jgi:hypothetical protein
MAIAPLTLPNKATVSLLTATEFNALVAKVNEVAAALNALPATTPPATPTPTPAESVTITAVTPS